MKKSSRIFTVKQAFFATFCIFVSSYTLVNNHLYADCGGKIDAGPAFLHLDVLESGRTVKSVNMLAVKVDGWSFIKWGLCAKPTFLYGGKGSTRVVSAGCGFGFYIPLGDKCSLTPSIGCNFTQLKTTFHQYQMMPGVLLDLRERFRSASPYAALEGSYCFKKGWRMIGMYQYVWSRTHTRITNDLGKKFFKSSPKGSNFGFMLEADIDQWWSLNLGAAYNSSLTHEKHGLRGYGVRFGWAFWW